MRAVSGSILVLAAAILISPGLQNQHRHPCLEAALIFGLPVGIAGLAILVWGLFWPPKDQNDSSLRGSNKG